MGSFLQRQYNKDGVGKGMKYNELMKLLKRYENCIDCEVFINGDYQTLDIISQGIKIDEIEIG